MFLCLQILILRYTEEVLAVYVKTSGVTEWRCHICSPHILHDHVTSMSHILLVVVTKKMTFVKCGMIRLIIFRRRVQKQIRKLRGNRKNLLKAGESKHGIMQNL